MVFSVFTGEMWWSLAPASVYEEARPVTDAQQLEALEGCGKWFMVFTDGAWRYAGGPQLLAFRWATDYRFFFSDGSVLPVNWDGLRVTDVDAEPPVFPEEVQEAWSNCWDDNDFGPYYE